jgi:hypothetical protein
MQAVDQRRIPPGRIKDGKQRFFMQAPKLGPTLLPVNPPAFQNPLRIPVARISIVVIEPLKELNLKSVEIATFGNSRIFFSELSGSQSFSGFQVLLTRSSSESGLTLLERNHVWIAAKPLVALSDFCRVKP